MPPYPIQYRRRGGPAAPQKPWIELYIGGQKIAHYGLVDSGADRSLVPKDLAKRIGIQYDENAEISASGAGGATFNCYLAQNQLAIWTEAGPFTFDQPLVADQDYFILGRADFFKAYVVQIFEREGRMELTSYEPISRTN